MPKKVELLDNANDILYPRTVTDQVAVSTDKSLTRKLQEVDSSIKTVADEVAEARTDGQTRATHPNLKARLDTDYKEMLLKTSESYINAVAYGVKEGFGVDVDDQEVLPVDEKIGHVDFHGGITRDKITDFAAVEVDVHLEQHPFEAKEKPPLC